ncbi:hypothetical protein, unknown function [Leishmania tarentolae]|uniref:Uncharacterized protein n=1 Tax=Leishmania tarentolae TaxID=5689 RepID=A0A640KXN9_LEITA|nr:hypothetical protein, unknown function [Leishmania tarentolae]
MQSVTEHRVLVYQCGARAVVNLSDIRRCSCISPSNLPSFESPTPFEGTRRDEVANIPSSTRATAGGKNALESLCSSLTMNMVTAPEGECCSDRAPSHTASSPSPRVPPPPPPTGCANLDAGDISSLLKNTGPQALSRHSAHHSVQGVSPSPLEDDVNCHGYSAALPENDHYSSWFAEWPPTALVTSSNSALLLRDQGSAEASLCCAAAGGVPPKWTSGVAVEDHETMNLFNQPRITPANTFPAGEVEAACLTGPPQGRTGECRCGVPPSHVGSRPSPLPQLPTSNIGSGITPISATGAERVLFDDDDFTDVSTPSARCHTLQPDLETAPAVPCAGADAVAHTPPRPCDIRRGALPASNCGGIGDCGSTGCNSRDPFLAHYTTTSLSSHTTPRTCVFSAEAFVGASGELLDAKPPSVCGHEKKDLTTKVTEESAEGSSPTAKDNLIEDTPCASTTFTWANGNLPAFKTPVISPLRQELLLRLLTTQAASAAYTPSVRTFSSGASPRNHGALGTPTPLHGSHGWRGASATSGGESLAEITGFPTPVKLSPIPTKGYSAHCEISASVTAATRGSTWTSATPASGLPSPTVFAGNGDAHECDAENPDLVTPAAAAHAIEAVEHVRASRRLTTGRSFSEGGRVGPLSHSSGPDSLSTAHSISSINSECSVSPICVRARQTTRVWSPHPSEVSQQQHPKPPLPSTEGHSSRSLTDFPSSSAVQHQPPQRQQSTVLCHSPVFGPVHAAPCDHTFSAHTNPCDTTVCPERAAAEVFEDLNAMSLMFTEVQAQPTHRQSHKLLHPVAGTGDLASLHNSTDRSAGERFTTRYAPDTVNLGTPTVSMIQSTGQALGESCCSLFMPPATQYIQALPIPGLQPRNPPSGQATQRSGLAVEGLGGESDTVGLANEARQNRRRQMQNAMLISPVLSDKEEENGIRCPTVGSCSTKRVLPRVQASPLVSSNDTSSMWERQPFAPKPEKNERDASAYLRTPFSTCFRSCEVEEEWGRHGCSVHSAPPCASSFAGQLKRPSCSRIAVTSPWENSHPHLRLPSRTDAPRHTEVPYVRYRPAFTASSQSATYFIDSWL